MPTLNKQYTLEITPERFLDACSRNELIEVGLLLESPAIQRKIYPEEAKSLDEGILASNAGEAYSKIAKTFLLNPIEANEIIFQITSKCAIVATEVLELMPLFQKLERLRIKSLVESPQEIPKDADDRI